MFKIIQTRNTHKLQSHCSPITTYFSFAIKKPWLTLRSQEVSGKRPLLGMPLHRLVSIRKIKTGALQAQSVEMHSSKYVTRIICFLSISMFSLCPAILMTAFGAAVSICRILCQSPIGHTFTRFKYELCLCRLLYSRTNSKAGAHKVFSMRAT